MIHTWAVTNEGTIITGIPARELNSEDYRWYWVDFDQPNEEESRLLETHFRFHPLAVEDCLYVLQRPKLDHYSDVHFFVLHTLDSETLAPKELDLFLSANMLVTFHLDPMPELAETFARWQSSSGAAVHGPVFAAHMAIDQIVDNYFPIVYRIEDELFDLGANRESMGNNKVMDRLFGIRGNLLKVRRTVFPMRDLLYRIVNSERIHGLEPFRAFFSDIHDHLLKLADVIESNQELTSEIRDSYISINSNRMNSIMKTLTVITTIFMPLTFLAGVYGMNFKTMPELEWQYGYFAVIAVMVTIGGSMYVWFKSKGWFD